MRMCVLNIRHFSFPSAPLCWLSFRQQSCCWHLLWKQPPSYERDVLHPSLPYSSLSPGHIGPDVFLLCVCVSHTKKVTITHAVAGTGLYKGCWIRRRHRQVAELLGQVNNYFERALWAGLLFVSLGLPLLLPHMITLWPGHRVLRETVFVFQKETLTSVLVGGCKYNIISRSLWLRPEIMHIYICAGTSTVVSRRGSHCLISPWLLEISIVARKINFHPLKVTTEPLCNPSLLCGQPSSLPRGEK